MATRARLGKVYVGDGEPVRLMGVINVSPESFYKGSVRRSVDEVLGSVKQMVLNGVDIVDIGGMSTAPYNKTYVGVEEELNRVVPVVKAVKAEYPELTISVDTFRARVAEEALKAGADAINDVTGLKGDPSMARIIADYNASAVVMARERAPDVGRNPVERTISALRESLEIALNSGISEDRLVIDPGIGAWPPLNIDPALKGGEPLKDPYIRGDRKYPWYVWDSVIIMNIRKIREALNRPILVGISRKSFLERLMRRRAPPEDRLYSSVAAEAIAVLMGADAVRTHNVGETRDAVRVAEALRACIGRGPEACADEVVKLTGPSP